MRTLTLWLVALSAIFAFAATPTPIVGVVLESESDLPLEGVRVSYSSGKPLGTTSTDGRFEYTVNSRNVSLLFVKEGYDSAYVELQDYADVLDMVVTLTSNLRDLGASTVVGGGEHVAWEPERTVSVAQLEDAAGMRFDLTEHLSQMPGVSGQKDFSSALYYEGSRAEDVSYHFGQMKIPNMRHLDIGFPGNLSVINPHVLSNIEIHDNYGSGPITQGLATSVQYIPELPNGDIGVKASAGLTVQEAVVEIPWIFWDSFQFSIRRLDGEMLKNLGEKFFTEFRKRDGDCADDCRVKSSDPFDLSAFDMYAQVSGSDDSGDSWAMRGLFSADEYTIRQDTTSMVDKVNSIDIIDGKQKYVLGEAEYNSKFGTSAHVGFVHEMLGDTLRDTTGFRSTASTREGASFIDGYEYTHITINAGLDTKFEDDFLDAKLSAALLYQQHFVERKYPEFGGTVSDDFADGVITGVGRFAWNQDYSNFTASAGGVLDTRHGISPLISADAEKNLSKKDSAYWRLFGTVAYRSDWKPYYDKGDLDGRLESNATGKAGLGFRSKRLDIQATCFGRYYFDPILPMPKAYAQYEDITNVDFAWALGGSARVEWKTRHHFSMSTNASSVYGEYEKDGSDVSLPWEANSRLDVVSHFRYYPRKDSMVSVILSHHAAWHRPLYYYKITPSNSEMRTNGARELRDLNEFTNLYRTDFRVNLDLQSEKQFFIFRNARFYLELDNIFANLDVSALRFLGAENARERSWVTRDRDDDSANGFDLVPFMAKGMGLYLQFGVEVQLGI